MFVVYCMQCCVSVSAVLKCVDVLSRGGISMFTMVICLVLLICTLTTSFLVQRIGTYGGEDMYFGCV